MGLCDISEHKNIQINLSLNIPELLILSSVPSWDRDPRAHPCRGRREHLTCEQLLLRLLARGKEQLDLGWKIFHVLLKKYFTSTGRPWKRREFMVELEMISRFSSAAESRAGSGLNMNIFLSSFLFGYSLILKLSSGCDRGKHSTEIAG